MADALAAEADTTADITAALAQVQAERAHDGPPAYILETAQAIAQHDPQLRAMNPPCKLTPAVAVRLLMAIRSGAHYETACAAARISYSTFVAWRNRAEDEDDHGPFATLMQALKVAEAEAELESIQDVRLAAKDKRFWAAAATFLERRHPDRWKRKDDSTVNVNVGVAIGLQSPEDARKVLAANIGAQIKALSPPSDTRPPLSLPSVIPVSGEQA